MVGPTLKAHKASLGVNIHTCLLYPAPTSQTTPSEPVLLRYEAVSATSPIPCDVLPGEGPESSLEAARMGVTVVGSPVEGCRENHEVSNTEQALTRPSAGPQVEYIYRVSVRR